MSRFSDQDKWKDVWFRKLSCPSKLLWLYILDNCDNAGFYVHDEDVVCLFTGMKQEHIKGAIEGLSRGLVGANSEGVYWVPDFIKIQKNYPLNEQNNSHKQILRILKERGEGFDCSIYLAPKEGLISPIGKGKGNSTGNGKVEYTPEFEEFWTSYGVGGKKPSFESWKKQKPTPEERAAILSCIPVYKAYCTENQRSLKDGQGWINGRFWETDWKNQPKQANPKPQNQQQFSRTPSF